MAKTQKTKAVKLKPFQKVLTVMISGKPVTKSELDDLLGKEIMMYRISTYMWHIKTQANGIVKVIKDGRKVSGYQLINVDEVKEYMRRAGVLSAGFTPAKVTKLEDLKAEELTDAQVEDIVTKAELSEITVTEVTQ